MSRTTQQGGHRLKARWIDALWLDWLVPTVAIASGVMLVATGILDGDIRKWMGSDSWSEALVAVAGVCAILTGFCTTAIAIYVSSDGRSLVRVKRHAGPAMRRQWFAVLYAPLAVAGVAIVAVAFDTPTWLGWVVLWFLAFGALRAFRLCLLFQSLITIADADAATSSRLDPPQVVSGRAA